MLTVIIGKGYSRHFRPGIPEDPRPPPAKTTRKDRQRWGRLGLGEDCTILVMTDETTSPDHQPRGRRLQASLRSCAFRRPLTELARRPRPEGVSGSARGGRTARYTRSCRLHRFETMTDTVSSQTRSRMMSRIRSTETSPERRVRSYLQRHGFRFRKNVAGLPGRPDVVLKRHSAAVFVHGCFWHQHAECRDGRIPESNTDYWQPKLKRTKERDQAHQRQLREAGWHVFVVWECEICPDRLGVLAQQVVSPRARSDRQC